jgi:hypothetical protein
MSRRRSSTVYRARDTKLNRDVALKVLPKALTADGVHNGVQSGRFRTSNGSVSRQVDAGCLESSRLDWRSATRDFIVRDPDGNGLCFVGSA